MFTLTHRARSVVQSVTGHQALSTRSGLRITSGASETAPMQVALSRGPEPHDQVVEDEGARLFLGPGAMDRLDGRTLDTQTEDTGRVHFVLKERG